MKIYRKFISNIETGKTVYEDSFNYTGKVIRCKGGSTTIAPPVPTPEEIALQKMQLEMLQSQQADYASMQPFILQSMGLKTDSEGNIIQMTDEERRAGMTPEQLNAYELLLGQQERQAQALAGELPISPALQKSLASQRTQMEEALAQRLGPNWMSTTAGQQAITAFDEKASLLQEEARRGQLEGGAGIALMQQGALGDVSNRAYQQAAGFGGMRGGLFQMAGQAQAPHAQQRQWQHQANISSAQNRAGQQAGFMGGLGSLMGAGMQAYGTYAGMAALASSVRLKENIKTIDSPIEKVMAIRGVEFDWKPIVEFNKNHELAGHDIGVIAEEVEKVMPEAIPMMEGYKHVEYYKIIPLLIEAIKSQQHEIKELKEKK